MHNFSSADADRHMVNMTIPGIKDKISCPGTGYADLLSYTRLCTGCSRQINSKLSEYCLGETGAVCTMSQTGTTIHIWISYKLQRIGSDCRTVAAAEGTAGIVTAASARRLIRGIRLI